MCGRYASFLPAEAIARIFRTVNPLPNLAPSMAMAFRAQLAANFAASSADCVPKAPQSSR
jgi:hypothetical protein